MDESQKHYVKQRGSDTKGYIVYDYICIKFKNRHSLMVIKDRILPLVLEDGINRKGSWGTFWSEENVVT